MYGNLSRLRRTLGWSNGKDFQDPSPAVPALKSGESRSAEGKIRAFFTLLALVCAVLAPAATTAMNVVALVSGGKDSTMNMLRCVEHGHKIVALANLYREAKSHHRSALPSAAAPELIIPMISCPCTRREVEEQDDVAS